MTLIKINGNTLDCQAPTVRALGLQADNATESNYILVQIKPDSFTKDTQSELEKLEVFIHEKVGENTYLCGYKPEDFDKIKELPFVTYANIYQPFFALQAGLKKRGDPLNGILPSADNTSAPVSVYIQLHRNVKPTDKEIHQIASAARVDSKFLTFSGATTRVTVQQKYLNALASIDVIKSIQEAHPLQLHNNVARTIINADVSIAGVAFRGEGQVVAVADTGFDKGDINDIPAPFAGRVAHLYAVSRPTTATTAESTDDPNGHGTHVCGSVLGDGTSTTDGRVEAPASQATLVMQSLLNATGDLIVPGNLMDLFAPPYNDFEARVHTNSWGSSHDPKLAFTQFPYDVPAENIDQFVWENRDMVILFSAGNDGADTDLNGVNDGPEIGSQACAKNCITVGATESLRTNNRVWSRTKWGAPIADDPVADNAEGMAPFSSRGPTVEGRIKPDVVAPGTSILSTHSRIAGSLTDFGTSTDPDWQFNGGTSMATPLVAGCAAVLRETWVKNGHNPSAALIKCLLINGAVDIDGQYSPSEAGPSPNFSAGWGRVNLAGSVILPGDKGNAGWGDDQSGIDKGDPPVIIPIDIPKDDSNTPKLVPSNTEDDSGSVETTSLHAYPHPTLKVTIVWSDPPGANLQNDLDLSVRALDSQRERHGNQGTRDWPLGAKEVFDRVNNVEQVVWTNMPAGKAEIVISGWSITEGPQPYAWAWRIY